MSHGWRTTVTLLVLLLACAWRARYEWRAWQAEKRQRGDHPEGRPPRVVPGEGNQQQHTDDTQPGR